jgi:curved DNA-binding protein CbpA
MDQSIAAWLAVLDKVSHYELLGVQPGAGADALRRAYQGFAANFHPDAHAHRTPEERTSVNTIFKRGTEAYRVLADPQLCAKYEQQRTGKTVAPGASGRAAPLPPGSIVPSPPSATSMGGAPGGASLTKTDAPKPGAKSNVTGRLEDFVREPRARPYAQQAEQLAKKGEHGKAKLQLKLAMNFDPKNEALEAYLKELDTLIEADKRKPWVPK